jgi:predicted MPP superfamily phosphohydrolase
LLRFLRARKFKLKDVIKMWGDFIDWRKKNNVDTIEVKPLLFRILNCQKFNM